MLRADSPVVCSPRRGAAAVVLLGLTACSGTIIFGSSTDSGGPRPDSGIVDSGGGGYPDAETYPDATTTEDGGPDAGGECMPSYPMTWPYDRGADYYWTFFGEWSVANGCQASSCHSNLLPNRDPPYMPFQRTDLDNVTSKNLAIAELWASILPGDMNSSLIKRHRKAPEGDAKDPLYLDIQQDYVIQFVMNAAVPCQTPTTAPDAGMLMPDAGDLDGGPVDGGPTDTGPTDI